MADAIVFSVILRISSALEAEKGSSLPLLAEVRQNMVDIKKSLELIQIVVSRVESISATDGPAAVWIGHVRETAYEIEDVIDEFTYFITEQKRNRFMNFLANVRQWKNIHDPRGFVRRLKVLQSSIRDITERGSRYDIEVESGLTESRERQPYPADVQPKNFVLVGRESDIEKLMGWLMDEEEMLVRMSVVGMGGLGKTALVAKVYESEKTKKYFECRAWITISTTYRIDDVIRSIIKQLFVQIAPDIETMDTRRLAQILLPYLINKRYVIVFDDVWDVAMWESICVIFTECKCKSRIIFTTRSYDVATSLASSKFRVYQLALLRYDQAWTLFCINAFQGDLRGVCPPELEETTRFIVDKCDGLPLAIVTLAGVMYSKRSMTEWYNVSRSWMLCNNPQLGRIPTILLFSFHDLPHYLKNCFLYCSIFPEDYQIKRKRIIRLWVAEGFVEERQGMTAEDVGEVYLNELIQRNMLQVTKTNYRGRLKEFHMHDVIREVVILISRQQNFCMRFGSTSSFNARRLSIVEVDYHINQVLGKASHLRSLVFAADGFLSDLLNTNAIFSFRLLRVLVLQGASIENIPDSVSNMFNLRFLSLRGTKVQKLPKSLGRLQNLQTLDLQFSSIKRLPSGVTKLCNLQHLLIIRSIDVIGLSGGMRTPRKLWALKNLQTLKGIVSNNEVVQQVQNLEMLRSFVILEVKKSDGAALCASIEKMTFLSNLQVQAMDEGEELELESLASPPCHLEKLFLIGHMKGLPRWFSLLNSLTVLRLRSSGLNEDPLNSLQSLPLLVCLELHKAFEGEELRCEEGGFRSLKILRLIKLSQLKQIRIGTGALGSLRELQLSSCRELNTLPQGIECLTTLKKLYFEVSEELLQRMQPNGDEYQKIRHIPTVDLIPRDCAI